MLNLFMVRDFALGVPDDEVPRVKEGSWSCILFTYGQPSESEQNPEQHQGGKRPCVSMPVAAVVRCRMSPPIREQTAPFLGVKATLAIFRTRVWAGGSTFAKVGIDLNPPSSSALVAIGHGGRRGELAL